MRTLLDMLPTTVQSTVCARVWPEVALKRLAEVIETLPDADARLLLLRNLPQKPLCSRLQLILAKGACDFANESFPFLLKCAYPRNTERLDVDHDLAAAKAVATRVFRMDVMRFKRFAKGAIRPRASDCEAAQDLTRFLGVCDLVFTCSNMPYDLESARKIQALANVVNIFGIPYENGTEVCLPKYSCAFDSLPPYYLSFFMPPFQIWILKYFILDYLGKKYSRLIFEYTDPVRALQLT